MKKITKTEVIRDFLRNYPNKDKIKTVRNMARIILESEVGHLFNDLEEVRGCLRGVINRPKEIDLSHFDKTIQDNSPRVEIDNSPYVIKGKDILILSDLQFPYYDKDAFRIAVKYAKQQYKNLDKIFINGDWFDFYQASDYMKDPRLMRVKDELDGGCDLIKMLQDEFGVDIVLKFGNHEERFDNYILKRAGEMKGIPEFELQACILKRVEDGLTIVKDKRIVKIGNLNVLHGHEFRRGMSSPVNPARGLWTRAMTSALQGDCHQPSTHYEKTLDGRIYVTYSTGCLCQLNATYMPYNKWLHGFARCQVEESGEFWLQNRIITNGKVF